MQSRVDLSALGSIEPMDLPEGHRPSQRAHNLQRARVITYYSLFTTRISSSTS